MRTRLILAGLFYLVSTHVWADKVIMRDGKIYEGHIMGETSRSVLISNPPLDPKPRFLELKDVLTIVRESRPPEQPTFEDGRFASATLGLNTQFYSSDVFSFSPAAGLTLGGAFRVHPVIDVGVEMVFTPNLSGDLGVTDGVNLRSYHNFYAYEGGFSTKIFPFFQFTQWRMEPYLTTGYHWSRLVPKVSGDAFKGTSLFGGAGVMIPWWKPVYWDLSFLYKHTDYGSIDFLSAEGDLSGITHNSYILGVGLSYRFS